MEKLLPVLIVEDNRACAKLIKLILEEIGLTVEVLSDIYKATSVLDKKNYGALVVNIVPSHLINKTEAKIIKTLAKKFEDRVIATTACIFSNEIQELGISNVIPKPFKKEDFYQIFRGILNTTR